MPQQKASKPLGTMDPPLERATNFPDNSSQISLSAVTNNSTGKASTIQQAPETDITEITEITEIEKVKQFASEVPNNDEKKFHSTAALAGAQAAHKPKHDNTTTNDTTSKGKNRDDAKGSENDNSNSAQIKSLSTRKPSSEEIQDPYLAAFKRQSEEEIAKLKQMTSLKDTNATFNWEKAGQVYEHIFSEYEREMSEISQEMGELEKEKSIWIDSALFVDEQKASEKYVFISVIIF